MQCDTVWQYAVRYRTVFFPSVLITRHKAPFKIQSGGFMNRNKTHIPLFIASLALLILLGGCASVDMSYTQQPLPFSQYEKMTWDEYEVMGTDEFNQEGLREFQTMYSGAQMKAGAEWHRGFYISGIVYKNLEGAQKAVDSKKYNGWCAWNDAVKREVKDPLQLYNSTGLTIYFEQVYKWNSQKSTPTWTWRCTRIEGLIPFEVIEAEQKQKYYSEIIDNFMQNIVPKKGYREFISFMKPNVTDYLVFTKEWLLKFLSSVYLDQDYKYILLSTNGGAKMKDPDQQVVAAWIEQNLDSWNRETVKKIIVEYLQSLSPAELKLVDPSITPAKSVYVLIPERKWVEDDYGHQHLFGTGEEVRMKTIYTTYMYEILWASVPEKDCERPVTAYSYIGDEEWNAICAEVLSEFDTLLAEAEQKEQERIAREKEEAIRKQQEEVIMVKVRKGMLEAVQNSYTEETDFTAALTRNGVTREELYDLDVKELYNEFWQFYKIRSRQQLTEYLKEKGCSEGDINKAIGALLKRDPEWFRKIAKQEARRYDYVADGWSSWQKTYDYLLEWGFTDEEARYGADNRSYR